MLVRSAGEPAGTPEEQQAEARWAVYSTDDGARRICRRYVHLYPFGQPALINLSLQISWSPRDPMRSLSLEGLGQELRAAFLDVDGETQRELKFKEKRQKRSEDRRDRGNPWRFLRILEDLLMLIG